jgi:flagellar hook-length control protein FliK
MDLHFTSAAEAAMLGSPATPMHGHRKPSTTPAQVLPAQEMAAAARQAASERPTAEALLSAVREPVFSARSSHASLTATAANSAEPTITPVWASNPTGPSSWASTPSAAVPATYTAQLPQVPGSAAWQQALGQQLILMSQAQLGQAELQLNPLELGPLRVSLQLMEGGLVAQFSAEQHAVREAVQAALPQLRSALAEHGLSLGQTQVGADTRGSAQERKQNQPRAHDRAQQPTPAHSPASPALALNAATTPAALGRLRTWA